MPNNLNKAFQKTLFSGLLIGSLSVFAPSSMAETYQVVYHVVESGETLSELSTKFGIEVKDIQKVNGMTSTNINTGERLLIPVNKLILSSNISNASKVESNGSKIKSQSSEKKTKTARNQLSNKQAVGTKHSENYQKYRVQSGDTLSDISLKYGVSVDAIAKANNIDKDYVLMIGDLFVIPTKKNAVKKITKNDVKSQVQSTKKTSKTSSVKQEKISPPEKYKVVSGDTLGHIAIKYNITVDDIIKLNELEGPDELSIGQELKLAEPKPAPESKPSADYNKISKSTTY